MERIRILLAGIPRLLREIIESVVATQPDMSIVDVIDARDRIPSALDDTPADVVIVGLRRGETSAALDPMLHQRPQLKLLAIAGDGRSSFLYELRPHHVSLGDVSPEGLVDAIRTSVGVEGR